MTDNRAIELREKLDELGIEHFDYDKGGRTQTMWESPGDMRYLTYETAANPAKTAKLIIEWFPTPEQAVAATLGNPTCEYVIEDNMNESEGMGDVWFRCTNCDTTYDYYADDWLLKMPHCPKCGATVKGVK